MGKVLAALLLVGGLWAGLQLHFPQVTVDAFGPPRLTRVLSASSSPRAPSLPVARVRRSETVFRSGPGDSFERLHPLTQGLQARILKRRGDWLQLWPGTGWVHSSDVVQGKFAPSSPRLSAVQVDARAVRLRLGEPAAWQAKLVSPSHLRVELPAASVAGARIVFPPPPRLVQWVDAVPHEKGVTVDLRTSRKLWGWGLRWEGGELVVDVIPAPETSGLSGLHVVLDPGHGGLDGGAVGWGGLTEKELNLTVSRAVQRELASAGARVTLTRTGDYELEGDEAGPVRELSARVRLAEEAGGHVFLSIHHESIGYSWASGTRVFYYTPQSRELASALEAPLARAIGEKTHYFERQSLLVIRQTRMPSVLIEANFLSNPEVERRMQRPDYAPAVARGIREGLEAFLSGS